MKCLIYLFGLFALAAAHFDLDALEEELRLEDFQEVNTDVFLGRRNFIRKACSCDEQNVCTCCATPTVFGTTLKGCASFRFDVNEKRLYINIRALNSTIVDTSFPTSQLENVCGQLPGRASILSYCLTTETSQTAEGGLLSCSRLEILVKQTPAAEATFTCLRLQDGKISFEGQGGAQNNSPVSIKVKNPLKVCVDVIKSLVQKDQEAKN